MDVREAFNNLLLAGNLRWKSGTTFIGTFDHAITAARTWTFPDATDTVAVLGTAQTFTGGPTFSRAGLTATFTNTSDAASVQAIILEGDRATVADGDEAYISLRLSDSGGNQDEGARITWKATTVLAGATQDTDLILSALVNNALTTMLTLDGSANEMVAAVDLNIAAKKLKTSNLVLKETASTYFAMENTAGSAYVSLICLAVDLTTLNVGDLGAIQTGNTDDDSFTFKARDNGVGLVEVGQIAGSTNPYFRIGRDDTGVALNAVTDMLVLQAGGGTGNEAANFGLGISLLIGNAASQVEERGSIDLVLVTATDGAEDVRLDWNLMAGGAMNLAMQLSGAGVLDVDASSGLGAATVGLFDDYDDAIVLRQGISEQKLDVLEQMGVMRRKATGSGWMLNVQAMLYLLAGGVYQTRQMLENEIRELRGRLLALEGAR